jgi:hypothetical protein
MKTVFSALVTLAVLVLASVGVYAQDATATPEPKNTPTSCTVSTQEARVVRVRVGPGENRTSVTFLPDHVEVVVSGQAEDDAGNLWYQVDKEVAAPGRAINEAWVLAEEVETSGACAAIADAAAPPIIPIIQRPTPSADGTDSAGETAATNIMPNAGSWTLGWGPSITFSCPGQTSETVSTRDYVSAADMQWTSELTNMGISIYPFMFHDTLMRDMGNGTYQGELFFFDDTGEMVTSTVYIDAIVSPNQMAGRTITSAFECTTTFTWTANHN